MTTTDSHHCSVEPKHTFIVSGLKLLKIGTLCLSKLRTCHLLKNSNPPWKQINLSPHHTDD